MRFRLPLRLLWLTSAAALVLLPPGSGPLRGEGDPPAFQAPPEKLAGGAWRLRWSTVAGAEYRLERSINLTRWDPVATLTATGEHLEFSDSEVPADADKVFWRAIRLGVADTVPPVVSILQVRRILGDGSSSLELTVQATDNVGVVGVSYNEGVIQLGAATEGPVGTWKRIVPIDPNATDPRQFQARAIDAAGNTGFSDIYTFIPGIQGSDLIPLDPDGNPAGDSLIGQKPDGSLYPFTYLPDLNGGASPNHSLRIDFPQGGTMTETGDGTFLEGGLVRIGFGPDSPTQMLDADGEPGFIEISATGAPLRIRRGELDFDDLAALMELGPGEGIRLRVHGRSELLWKGGTLTREGIRGGVFSLVSPSLGLPPDLGGYGQEITPLHLPSPVGIAVRGSLDLGNLGRLEIPRARPLTLRLHPGGEVTLKGSADLFLRDGSRFHVDVLLDDPLYSLSLRAGNLEIPLIGSLADLLPSDPAACVPTATDEVSLNQASACLRAHERAYRLFIAGARSLRPDAAADAAIATAPGTADLTGAAIDAWSSLASLNLAALPPGSALSKSITTLQNQTRGGASDPFVTLEAAAILKRLANALEQINEDATASDINAAILAAKPSLLRALEHPDALQREVLGDLVLVLASMPFDFDPELSAAAENLLRRAVKREADAIGVLPGVLTPESNPTLLALNPYEGFAIIRRLSAINEAANGAGYDATAMPLYEETCQQIFAHAYQVVLAAIDRHIAERNPFSALTVIGELAEIQANESKTPFDITTSPSDAALQGRIAAAASLIQQAAGLTTAVDPGNPVTRDQVFTLARQFEGILDVASRLPDGEPVVEPAATTLLARLDTLLPSTTSSLALAAEESEQNLVLTLRAIFLHQQLKRRFPAVPASFNGFTQAIGDLASRLADIAITTGDSKLLLETSSIILHGADQLELAARENPAGATTLRQNRRLALLAAATLLEDVHPLAVTDWTITESRRGADPDTFSADALLPGNLKIDSLAGSIRHHRLTGETLGKFTGSIRLPKLDSSLTIHRGSIDNNGNIDLAASGALRLPGSPEAPIVSLTVPSSQPLQFTLAQGRPPKISGRAKLEFDNGTSVAVGLRFDDPIYTFQAEAGSLDTGLRDAILAVNSPQLGSLDATIDWLPHYENFANWLESSLTPNDPAGPPPADDFPGFSEQPPFDTPALLDAWLSRAIAEARAGSTTFVTAPDNPFAEAITNFSTSIATLAQAYSDFFTPQSELNAREALKRLGESARLQRKLAELLNVLAANELTGGPGLDATLLNELLIDATIEFNLASDTILADPNLRRDPGLVRQTVTAGFDLAASIQLTGGDPSATESRALSLLRAGMTEFLSSRGLLPNGQINGTTLATLDATAVEETFREFFRFHGELLVAGDTLTPPQSHIGALAFRLANLSLADIATLTTPEKSDDVSEQRLFDAVRRLRAIFTEINPNLDVPVPIPVGFDTSTTALLHRDLLRLAANRPSDDWASRAQLLEAAAYTRELRLIAGGQPLDTALAEVIEGGVIRSLLRTSGPRITPTELTVLRSLAYRRNESNIVSEYRARLGLAALSIQQDAQGPWTPDKLPLAETLIQEITWLDELADPAYTFPLNASPAQLLALVRQRVAETAPPARKAKVPASLARIVANAANPDPEEIQIRAALGAPATAIKDAIDPASAPTTPSPALAAVLQQETTALLNVSRDAIQTLATDPRPAPSPDLALPGDLQIQRAFGGFYFDRISGFFRGTFGGRLLFPDPRATFEITEATFDNLGNFSINAATTTPVTVMDNDRATLAATLAIAGSPLGLQSVSGTGTLTVPFGPDQPGIPGTRSYNGTFSYQPEQPGKPLTFTAAVDGVQNEFKLGDDFALFDGNLALTFSTESPDTTLHLGGKAGFFARPDAPPALGEAGEFWVVCDIDELEITATENGLLASFTGGTLNLAQDLFQSDIPGGDGFVRFDLTGTLGVDFPFDTGIPSFFGNDDPAQPFRVAGSNFRFRVPGIEDSLITVNTCELELFQDQFPVLTSLDASFRFPLPGINSADPSQRVPEFGLNVENWAVDGFPPDAATITLNNGLSLIDLDGLDIDLLGAAAGSFPPVSLTFLQLEQNGETFTRMELEGGMRVGIESALITPKPGTTPTSAQNLTTTAGAMRTTVAGAFGWTFAPGSRPAVALDEIVIEGNFLLGGSLEIGGIDSPFASLRIRGFNDLFIRNTPADPFSIELTASVAFEDIGSFALNGARFVWRDPDSAIPDFDIAGAGLVLGDSLSTLLSDGMPIYVKSLALNFLDADRPLIGTAGNPGRFDPDNIELILTAGAEFPPAPPVDIEDLEDVEQLPPTGPRIGGEITNLRITYPSGNLLLPEFSLDAVRMGIEGLDVPPLKGLSGQVALLNLDQLRADPPRPDLVTFAGEMKADFNGTGVGVLLAASPNTIHGAGITASLPGGIPLDGGVLGGILWNGASGGIHFKNSFDDPTEFESYLERDGQGNFIGAQEFPPPGSPGVNEPGISDPFDEIAVGDDLYVKPEMETPPGQQFDEFDVLRDNWPPQAVNPFLEEFPANSGRLVFIGSRKSPAEADAFLNSIGILPGDTRTAEEIITAFITGLTADIRAQGDAAVLALLAASGQQNNAQVVALYQETSDKLVASFDDVARPILRGILQPVGLSGGPSVREQMHDLLTAGVPGFNVTFLGSGTFTHTAVAPVMDLKGTISASTTGAALTRGELRLAGIPVAEASLGLSLTRNVPAPTPDNPDRVEARVSPFLGGLARVGIGPLQLGKVTMAASMPDAASIVDHFDAYLQCTTTALSSAAAAQLQIIAETATNARVPAGTSLQDFLLARSDQEKLAVIGSLFEYFAQTAEGTLPAQFALANDDLDSLIQCFAVFVANTLNSLTPEIAFGGKIEPSIFDIPMTTSGMPLASARMRYGPVLRQPDPSRNETFIGIRGNPAAFTDPLAPPGKREFSAYLQFSPSAALLAPITGTFVAINPTNAAFAGFSAIDYAEFGFSFQQSEWTPEKVVVFLKNPANHFASAADEFFNTAVFAAGYQMSPFGMNLADGQLRLVFPDSGLHPRRPSGINADRLDNPVDPLDANGRRVLPTTDELILAALTAGKIKDATFRGEPGELVDLFPVPPPVGEESPDGNIAKIQRISRDLRANDPTLTALAGKSFAKDYFPYGGIIGGGQLALPRLLTQGLPDSWGALFAPNLPAEQWLTAFGTFAEDLSSTETVGQLAYYIPAPNPVIFPGEDPDEVWADISIDELLSRLRMDPASLIGRSINPDLYEIDEIVLAGWAQADLLGIPLGEARMKYDGSNRRLEAIAQSQPGSWFSDFFSAEATFAIQLPSDQEAGLVTYSTSQLFELIEQNITQSIPDPEDPDASLPPLQSLSGPELDARIAEIQESLSGALPRISAEIESGVSLPPGFEDFVRTNGQIAFFAYSPYFDPTFEPANDRPRAIARRQGGLGIEGALELGYFSPDGDPANDVFINVANASLALSVPTGPGLPGLSGNFEVAGANLPIPIGGLGSASLENLRLAVNTDPAVGQNYFLASGSVPPVNLGGFLRIDPLSGNSIGGEFIVSRATESGPPSAALALRPAKISFPGMIEGDLDLRIHGTAGEGTDFTLATSGDFGAAITLRGGMTLRDPFNNLPLVTLTGPTAPISGTLSRTGNVMQTSFTLPSGFSAQFHPLGQTYTFSTAASLVLRSDGTFDITIESADALEIPDFFRIGPPPGGTSQLVLTRNAAGIAKLRIAAPQLTLFPGANGLDKPTFALPDLIEIESTGRFYVNVGPRTLDLFGAVQAEGHLEFGYEPVAPNATHDFSLSHSTRTFTSQLRGRASALPLTVANTGSASIPLALELSGTGAANFHLSHSSLNLAPGTNQPVTITFISRGNSDPATLTVRPLHGLAASKTVTLSAATATPTTSLADLVRSETTLGFGQFAAGLTEGRTALLMNAGNAAVDVTNVTVPAGMTLQSTATGPLAPGETRVVPITYAPTASGTTGGSLSYTTTPGTTTASLSGTIVNRNFIRVHQSARPFVSLSMAGDYGTATDADGRIWRTTNQGASWKPEAIRSLPASTTLQPKVLTATSGAEQFKWLVGKAGEFWQATPESDWTRSVKPELADPTRDWTAIARHSNTGTPLALVAGNQGSTGIIIRETAPGSFAELTFANTTLRGIATNTSDQTALAIGSAGKLFRSTNGGASFSTVSVASTTADLLSADISSSSGTSTTRTAVIGASGGAIFRSTNSGASWSAASISAPGFVLGDIVSVAIEGTRGLAVDSKGVLLTSSNSGATWTAGEQGFTRARIRSVARSGSDFWALTENGEIHYRIPDSGLQAAPLTLMDDFLSLGYVPTTTPGPHLRSTGITNVGNTTLNLTFTPSGGNVTVTPSSATLAPGQSLGVRVGLATTSTVGNYFGTVTITAAGFSKPHIISIGGTVQSRVWAIHNNSPTTSTLIDVETRDANIRHALSSSHFYQTLDRGSNWTTRALPTSSARAMFFTSSTTGVVVGGSTLNGVIYRTTDSGATWTTVLNEVRTTVAAGRAVTDVHIRSTNVGYAVTRGASTSIGTFIPGRILRTTDGGATWTSFNGPPGDSSFSATSVHAVSDTRAFVTSNDTIYVFDTTTPGWTAIRSFGSGNTLRRIRFATDNTTGWAVGNNSLFAVTTSGGTTANSWGPFLELFPSGGTFEDLCFDIAGHAKTILNRPNSMQVWQQGATGNDVWSLDAFPFAVEATTPRGRAIDMASSGAQGTIVGDGGVIWMYDATPNVLPDRAIVTSPSLDFGIRREAASPVSLNLTVLNPTTNSVIIQDAIIDNPGAEGSFSTTFTTATLAAGGSTNIAITFSGTQPGLHEGLLTLVTNGHVGLPTRVRLSAIVQAEPAGLIVRTNPPALSLSVGGSTSAATATRVVRDGSAGSGELNVGQPLALSAAPTQTISGVTYKFSNWTGGAGGIGSSITHTAGNSSRFAEAIYRPYFPITTISLPEAASPTGGASPAGRPASGAWIRLTGAKLKVPSLRDFVVSGEMFLSGQAIRASLASTAIQVPATASPILDVGAGSWTLDWTKNGPFRFSAASPSVKVLNSDLLPSSAAQINFLSNGDFDFDLALPDGFQDVTGLFEISPDGGTPANIGFGFSNNTLSFNLKGRLRALNNGGNGWLFDQAINIQDSAQIFPQTFSLPVMNFGAFAISSGSLNLTRNTSTGAISLGLSNVTITGALGTLPGLNATLDSTGTATFLQTGDVNLGPFTLKRRTAGTSTSLSLNGLTGAFSVNLPASYLNARSGQSFADRWPVDAIELPSFACDSTGAIDLRIPLPTLSIDDIPLAAGGEIETNHIRLRRTRAGVVTATLRDRQDFRGNISDLEFSISSAGAMSGRYFGEMSFFGLQLGMVRMTYNSAATDYQFEGTFRALGDPNLSVECGYGSAGTYARPPFVN